MNTSPPLLFLDLLADRPLTPAAVLFRFSDGSLDSLLTLLMAPSCLALVEEFPSFVDSEEAHRLPPDSLQALLQTGVKLLPVDIVHLSEDLRTSVVPASAQWITGNWYLTPPPKPAGSQATSRALALKLLQMVTSDSDSRDIEEIFRRAPELSYHLLRIVNSVGMGASKKISSLAQAILILGRQQLKRWLSLMLFSAGKEDSRSAMLLARAALRARSMELLARSAGLDRSWQELSFMAGMFSLLGILFGLPLSEILKPLQISDLLVDALLRHENEVGHLLKAVELAESGSASELQDLLKDLGLSSSEFNTLVIEAHLWMLRFVCGQQANAHG